MNLECVQGRHSSRKDCANALQAKLYGLVLELGAGVKARVQTIEMNSSVIPNFQEKYLGLTK